MGERECQPSPGAEGRQGSEILDPRHFYAAYVFDRPDKREQDVQVLIEASEELGYEARYWWLSDAMELKGSPNRLIVCVHHPSTSEDAGMDLYEALKEKGARWDELEAAAMDEYRDLGADIKELGDFRSPHGDRLFPRPVLEGERFPHPDEALLMITKEDVRDEAQSRLGRDLTDKEYVSVLAKFKDALDCMDWTFYLEEALRICQETGRVGPDTDEPFRDSSMNDD